MVGYHGKDWLYEWVHLPCILRKSKSKMALDETVISALEQPLILM